MHTHRRMPLTPIESGLDRQSITQIKQRFLHLNQQRLTRAQSLLSKSHTQFLKLLPLLLHCNHPALPGFINHQIPAGINQYKPTATELKEAKTFARSFIYHTPGAITPNHQDPIWGLYLMGSLGSLAQNNHSDFDVWLCYRPDLPIIEQKLLAQKCQRISQWAKSQALEIHFFLMDCDAFRAGQALPLDAESSGSAQRFLLLDEFYRSHLYLAGRLPLWWFIAPNQESHYETEKHRLLDKRFLSADHVLDFGPVHPIPLSEFLGASIWQLYKSIKSPYKSVLKLLLLEAYTHAYPHTLPVCMDFKIAIYNGQLDATALDAYEMAYRKIEHFLMHQQDQARLNVIRRCFYFKINRPASKIRPDKPLTWPLNALYLLLASWGWESEILLHLDQRADWKTLDTTQERNALIATLNKSYVNLMAVLQPHQPERSISNTEFNILGRKLHAAFETKSGKLDWINPGISKNISQPTFLLKRRKADHVTEWTLLDPDESRQTPLKTSQSLAECVLWGYANQLFAPHTQIHIYPPERLNPVQLHRLLSVLHRWLPLPLPPTMDTAFERAAQPTHLLLLINLDTNTNARLGHINVNSSVSLDPLNYGPFSDNLVESIDLLVQNSWQEIISYRFEGKQALMDCLKFYLSFCFLPDASRAPTLHIECLGLLNAALIQQRLIQWWRDLLHNLATPNGLPHSRLLFSIHKSLYSLQFLSARPTLLTHSTEQAMIHYLSAPQKQFSAIMLDALTLSQHPLFLMVKRMKAGHIQVHFTVMPPDLWVFIFDEKGSLVLLRYPLTAKLYALNTLNLFLRKHSPHPQPHQTDQSTWVPIEFYELRQDKNNPATLVPKVVPSASHNHWPLKASVRLSGESEWAVDLHFADESFVWSAWSTEVFTLAAQKILGYRQDKAQYPIYITDVSLEAADADAQHPWKLRLQLPERKQDYQTSHYLKIKMELEDKLNHIAQHLSAGTL